MARYIVLTFRRDNDGSLRCSSPKDSAHLNRTLDDVVAAGLRIESMTQGREDDDFDFLLATN